MAHIFLAANQAALHLLSTKEGLGGKLPRVGGLRQMKNVNPGDNPAVSHLLIGDVKYTCFQNSSL